MKTPKTKKESPKIIKVIKTKGNHSWVEAEIKGEKVIIRKENKNIPKKLFN